MEHELQCRPKQSRDLAETAPCVVKELYSCVGTGSKIRWPNGLMNTALPEFKRPPVHEVVLSVQFEKLENLRSPQLGYVWQAFRDRFPNTEDHPAIEPAFELFGSKVGVGAGVHFELLSSLPTPRIWFVNELGTELVQVQQDRFIRNWRKKAADEEYPRYSFLRDQFTRDFELFQSLVDQQGWGRIEPNQCEVTYVNIIPAGDGWSMPGELGKVFTLFNPSYSDSGLGPPEEAAVNARYILTNAGGEPVGRLHVAIAPVLRAKDGSPAFRLSLTARGRPEDAGTDSVLKLLDLGHEAIVRGFASITTADMHTVWEREP